MKPVDNSQDGQTALTVTLKQTRMGWCLFVNNLAYAIGSRAYCISVAQQLRSQQGGAA